MVIVEGAGLASVRAQVAEDGEYASVGRRRLVDVELLQQAVDVRFNRLGREKEQARDGVVRVSFGHQRQNVALAFGERVERAAWGSFN